MNKMNSSFFSVTRTSSWHQTETKMVCATEQNTEETDKLAWKSQ